MSHKTMILVVLLCAASAQAEITVTAWELISGVKDGNGPVVWETEEAPPVVLPFNAVSTATYGESEATSTYDFDVVGNLASFGFEFDHVRGGTPKSLAESFSGDGGDGPDGLTFSVSPLADLHYSLDGTYTMTGVDRAVMFAELRDLTTGTVVFSNHQVSHDTTDESFALGETGGDFLNSLTGNLTGVLTAGRDYKLDYISVIILRLDSDPDAGATAVGSLNLHITPCPPRSPCAADLNGDGVVNAADLAILLGAWGECSE